MELCLWTHIRLTIFSLFLFNQYSFGLNWISNAIPLLLYYWTPAFSFLLFHLIIAIRIQAGPIIAYSLAYWSFDYLSKFPNHIEIILVQVSLVANSPLCVLPYTDCHLKTRAWCDFWIKTHHPVQTSPNFWGRLWSQRSEEVIVIPTGNSGKGRSQTQPSLLFLSLSFHSFCKCLVSA